MIFTTTMRAWCLVTLNTLKTQLMSAVVFLPLDDRRQNTIRVSVSGCLLISLGVSSLLPSQRFLLKPPSNKAKIASSRKGGYEYVVFLGASGKCSTVPFHVLYFLLSCFLLTVPKGKCS